MDLPDTSLADAGVADTRPSEVQDATADEAVLVQSLVEEVSIDGMCGVY